ncbi:hypothetical protein B0T18DRAFT_429869 [Schizothecium vesticola]|uniref:Uncharacterized protein n=1 Tax=Schizothecium vesticola TaxID=314040 RepID=A0AA40EWX5_9PEZI|nr:hypothetical protein B0T18DRAFT_429869 [Schizothecium vesticola]
MDCKSAWDDVIAEWKREYRSRGDVQFSPLVMDKYGQTISGECGSEQWTSWSACPATASCSDHSGGILPAGAEVANALGRIHGVFQSYYRTIPGITYQPDLIRFPVVNTSTLAVAVLAATASSFNASLHSRPYFTHHPRSVLRASFTTLAQSLTSGINTTDPTLAGLFNFKAAWEATVSASTLHLFSGSDPSIVKLTALIADGRMAPGASAPDRRLTAAEENDLSDAATGNAGKVLHLVAMPAMAVRTFESNGGRNGGKPDFGEDSELVTGLYERGIESPGLVRLPVCSAEEASANVKKKERWDVYPCNMVEGSVPVPAIGARGGHQGAVGADAPEVIPYAHFTNNDNNFTFRT